MISAPHLYRGFVPFMRFAGVFLFLLLFPPLYFSIACVSRTLSRSFFCKGSKCLYRIMGIRVTVSGEILLSKPTLYIANHISYMDIIFLSSLINGCMKTECLGGKS